MSFLDKKPFIFVWRPFYRHFFVRLKGSFAAESLGKMDRVLKQLDDMQAGLSGIASRVASVERQHEAARSELAHRLDSLQHHTRMLTDRFSSVEHHHRLILDGVAAMEQENRKQWQMLEQLLLAFLSEPRRRPLEDTVLPGEQSEARVAVRSRHQIAR